MFVIGHLLRGWRRQTAYLPTIGRNQKIEVQRSCQLSALPLLAQHNDFPSWIPQPFKQSSVEPLGGLIPTGNSLKASLSLHYESLNTL